MVVLYYEAYGVALHYVTFILVFYTVISLFYLFIYLFIFGVN